MFNVILEWYDNAAGRELSPAEAAGLGLPSAIMVEATDLEEAFEDAPLNAIRHPAAAGNPELVPIPISARAVP